MSDMDDTRQRKVTEQDFRLPEFRGAKPEDFEFRRDGKIVRKDRWEQGIHTIRSIAGMHSKDFEISEVIEEVRKLALDAEGWVAFPDAFDPEFVPEASVLVEVRLSEGSRLRNATYLRKEQQWQWNGAEIPFPVVEWRDLPKITE